MFSIVCSALLLAMSGGTHDELRLGDEIELETRSTQELDLDAGKCDNNHCEQCNPPSKRLTANKNAIQKNCEDVHCTWTGERCVQPTPESVANDGAGGDCKAVEWNNGMSLPVKTQKCVEKKCKYVSPTQKGFPEDVVSGMCCPSDLVFPSNTWRAACYGDFPVEAGVQPTPESVANDGAGGDCKAVEWNNDMSLPVKMEKCVDKNCKYVSPTQQGFPEDVVSGMCCPSDLIFPSDTWRAACYGDFPVEAGVQPTTESVANHVETVGVSGGHAKEVSMGRVETEANRNFKVECDQSVAAKKKRNQCCHNRGGGNGLDAHRCEAEEKAGEEKCESGCFMIDRSEQNGGRKMCKPICNARNLVSKEEVNNMVADAQQAAVKAATSLDSGTLNADNEDVGFELTAAKIKLSKLLKVEALFSAGEDEETVEAQAKKEEKVVVAAVKDAAVEACNKEKRGTRLECCNKACRKEMDSVYPDEMRSISPTSCALPCNNAPDRV